MEVFKSMFWPEQVYSGKCRDDLTGQVLKDELVTKARAVERVLSFQECVEESYPQGCPGDQW